VRITEILTTTYERPDEVEDPAQDRSQIPCSTILWAAAALFTVNVLILAAIWLSPELRVGVYGAETESSHSFYKPSPFTEVVETAPAKPVRAAAKVRPVLYQDPEPTAFPESAEFVLPGSAFSSAGAPQPAAASAAASYTPVSSSAVERAQPVTGAALDRMVESYSAYPRVTASLNRVMPDAPARSSTIDVAPRRLSEQAVRATIN
jgi:hypothetical protein